jgi:trk system potassium uptake protein TrkH
MELRPIVLVVGILLTTLGAVMLVPALVDLAAGGANWGGFAVSALATLFCGTTMALATWGQSGRMTIREAFLLATLAWVALAAFAALPLYLSEAGLTYTDAFFESMSGITTTGATVVTGLEAKSPGFLLWRGLLQWLGGLGIIVMAVAVLPLLQVGGMQLFRVEAFEAGEKAVPRAAQFSAFLTLIYVGFTALAAAAYSLAGMNGLDAAVHAMTTIATGGYSNYDASIGHFDSTAIETICIAFMMVGSLPFLLYVKASQGRAMALWQDTQVRGFLLFVAGFSLLAYLSQAQASAHHVDNGIREAVFNVVSILTGTGYATVDYDNWGPMAVVLFFFLAFIGGCAGSTSCGIKIFRFQVMFEHMRVQLERLTFPNGMFTPRYGGRPIPARVSRSVMAFLLLFFGCFAALSLALELVGLDHLTALSAAASAIANVGPGLGPIVGPAGNYATLPDAAKWLLSFGMLIGRLELFTVLVLFTPAFWRN